jgi:hypothetical protein
MKVLILDRALSPYTSDDELRRLSCSKNILISVSPEGDIRRSMIGSTEEHQNWDFLLYVCQSDTPLKIVYQAIATLLEGENLSLRVFFHHGGGRVDDKGLIYNDGFNFNTWENLANGELDWAKNTTHKPSLEVAKHLDRLESIGVPISRNGRCGHKWPDEVLKVQLKILESDTRCDWFYLKERLSQAWYEAYKHFDP